MRIFEYTNISITLFCILLINCGEYAFRKDPVGLTMSRYENRSVDNHVLLAHSGDDCNLLLHKRIHNLGFVFPLNGYSEEEIKEIANQKMLRFKNVLRVGDIIWTLLLFWSTTLTYSIEIETCNTGMTVVPKHEMEYLKDKSKENGAVTRSEPEEVKKSIEGNNSSRKKIPVPVVSKYKKLILNAFNEDNQPYSVFFTSSKDKLNKQELVKLDSFYTEYSEKYSQYKIFLIGHSDWSGGKEKNKNLSLARALFVRNYLVKKGIPNEKILINFSAGLWPENTVRKQGLDFGRRVDLLFFY